ncbi:hypothetical protein NCC78_02465 [Micromonospora phytophila]|uniref:hypothetical protein n=1 Tax=Micromonospora phytophila TaxID=709888 RepID=UPI00202F3E0C|nr:hypothetical protein [Micromonospora phytophila]MCM0673583.1 hypothetical protein [Micromonospora phytophila]
MQSIDVDQLKRVLTAEKTRRFEDVRRLHAVAQSQRGRRRRRGGDVRDRTRQELDQAFRRHMPDAAGYFEGVQEDFRRGLRDRRRALAVLGTARPPATPEFTTLDTPFLIWGLRNGPLGGTDAVNLFEEVHYEAGASWVRFWSRHGSDSDFFASDEVNFYFFWQNTATDAVVNVHSFLMLAGLLGAYAEPGWFWSPFWGASTFGHCTSVAEAHLTVRQWWEQPPTQPLPQVDQINRVGSLSVSGGWSFWSPGSSELLPISGSAHVAYDTLWVPANGVVVFEVGLRMHYSGYDGSGTSYFDWDNFRLVCPQVQLEILTGTPVVHP